MERDKFFFLSLSHVVIVGRVIEELALHCACSFFPLFKRDLRFLNVVACCTRRHTGRQKWHKTFYYFQKNGKAFFPVAKNVTVGAYTGRQQVVQFRWYVYSLTECPFQSSDSLSFGNKIRKKKKNDEDGYPMTASRSASLFCVRLCVCE